MTSFFLVNIPLALATGILTITLGVLTAFVILRTDVPFEISIRSLVLGPLVIPRVILGLALLLFFARFNMRISCINLLIGHTLIALPYPFLIAITSLYTIDLELEEAARNFGASKFESFKRVTLPFIRIGVISGFFRAFIISFTDINIALFRSRRDPLTLPIAIFNFLQWEST